MIIIEGPDNSGKSGITNFLTRDLGVPSYHAGGPPKSKEDIMRRALFLLDNYGKYIFDRAALISEPVYSILRPGGSLLADEEHLYKRLRDLNPIIIFCRPPMENLLRMEKHIVKEHDTPEHVDAVQKNAVQLIARYDLVMEEAHLPPHIKYNYEVDIKADVAKHVRELIEQRKGSWPCLANILPPGEGWINQGAA